LQEAIDSAVQHNFDVQIQRYLPELARFNLQAASGGYDPTLFASGRHSYNLSPGGIDPQNRPFVGAETESDSFNAGLTGLLPGG
jgi:outer membrane protein TolC